MAGERPELVTVEWHPRAAIWDLSQPQRASDALSYFFFKFGSPIPPHFGRLNVCRALVVWFCKHRHDGYQDLFHTLDGRPSFGGTLVVVWIVSGRMEDGYADFAIQVHCFQSVFGPKAGPETEVAPLGCQISPRNFILGGLRG